MGGNAMPADEFWLRRYSYVYDYVQLQFFRRLVLVVEGWLGQCQRIRQ